MTAFEGSNDPEVTIASRRFSTAFSPGDRLFSSLIGIEDCLRQCDLAPLCLGVFAYTTTGAATQCYGLSALGAPVPTQLASISLAKAAKNMAEQSTMVLEFEGRSGLSGSGLSLRFGAAFSEDARLFILPSIDETQCSHQCLLNSQCRGVFYWRSKQVRRSALTRPACMCRLPSAVAPYPALTRPACMCRLPSAVAPYPALTRPACMCRLPSAVAPYPALTRPTRGMTCTKAHLYHSSANFEDLDKSRSFNPLSLAWSNLSYLGLPGAV